jgi:hypothetical protein
VRLATVALLLPLALFARAAGSAAPSAVPEALLAPPAGEGPVAVRVRFDLHDINEIDDSAETFEFMGVLTLSWRDPRLAFDPAQAGVEEKVYQGAYQFNEIATGWWPQIVLVNQSGSFETSGVLLRVRPDGTSILVQTLNAAAEADFDMLHFPFDAQRLEAVFEVLGYDRDQVRLEVDPVAAALPTTGILIPQWRLSAVRTSVRERAAMYAGRAGVSSVLVVTVDVQRASFYFSRLVILPLLVIVLLSFSVFWMDHASAGDRVSVSFIGILTGVAYTLVMSDALPRISYVTVMHAFLNLSILAMCAAVVVNVYVGVLAQRGESARAARIDHRCRLGFPLGYLAVLSTMFAVATLVL